MIQVFEMDAFGTAQPDYMDTPITDIRESVETNLWLAQAYAEQDSTSLRDECLKAALQEWKRFEPLLVIYCGTTLGETLKMLAAEWGIEA